MTGNIDTAWLQRRSKLRMAVKAALDAGEFEDLGSLAEAIGISSNQLHAFRFKDHYYTRPSAFVAQKVASFFETRRDSNPTEPTLALIPDETGRLLKSLEARGKEQHLGPALEVFGQFVGFSKSAENNLTEMFGVGLTRIDGFVCVGLTCGNKQRGKDDPRIWIRSFGAINRFGSTFRILTEANGDISQRWDVFGLSPIISERKGLVGFRGVRQCVEGTDDLRIENSECWLCRHTRHHESTSVDCLRDLERLMKERFRRQNSESDEHFEEFKSWVVDNISEYSREFGRACGFIKK